MVNDFDAVLAAKGYQKTATDGDLSLILTVGAREKTDVQSWGRFGMQTSVDETPRARRRVTPPDSKTAQAVWHGQASQTVNPQKPNEKAINAGVAKLMVKFPAGGGQAAAPPPPSRRGATHTEPTHPAPPTGDRLFSSFSPLTAVFAQL